MNSEFLFRRLVKLFNADLVCDVGSFDGAHALLFAKSGTHVVALEANPANAAALSADSNVVKAGIETLQLAAWNNDENIVFNVIDVPAGATHEWRNKISSIRTRSDCEFDSDQVTIQAVRLDSLVSARTTPVPSSVGLWIDVEGVGYEVLEGMSGIRNIVSVIHIEVETKAFWEGQQLWPDVSRLMSDFGFSAIARSVGDSQCNVIFTNRAFHGKVPFKIRCLISLTRVRGRLGRVRARIRRLLWRR